MQSDGPRLPWCDHSVEPVYDVDDFPEDKRPVIRTLNALLAAQEDGRIPRAATGGGPDYEAGQAVLHIPEENEDFRRAVAAVLAPGTYRIVVQPVYGRIIHG
jgi:hypothetical protein